MTELYDWTCMYIHLSFKLCTRRMKMFLNDFLQLLKTTAKICSHLKCLPCEYDVQKQRLVRIRGRQIIIFRIQCILSVLYCVVMFLNLALGSFQLIEKLIGVPFLLMYINVTNAGWNFDLDTTPIQVINGFMQFEVTQARGQG